MNKKSWWNYSPIFLCNFLVFPTFYVIMYASSLALISSLLNLGEWLYLFSIDIFKNLKYYFYYFVDVDVWNFISYQFKLLVESLFQIGFTVFLVGTWLLRNLHSVRLSIKKSPYFTKWDNHKPNFLTIK